MDRDATELSKAGLRLFSKEMSPEYERVRNMLLGYLASQGATTEQLAKKEVNDRQNVAMLSSFAKALPKAALVDNSWQFRTKDPYKVRVIQSNAVWFKEIVGTADNYDSYTWAYRPYYVVGKSGNGKETEWLLACAGADDTRKKRRTSDSYSSIFHFQPQRKSRSATQQLNSVASRDYPSPEEMTELFDLNAHVLRVGHTSPGSTKVRGRGLGYGDKPVVRISDETLGQLDTNSHLHRIATALDIEPRLEQILSEHSTV